MQLTDALQAIYGSISLGDVHLATGGSATTTIDALVEDGDEEGSIIVISTTDGLAPQGEFGQISDFDEFTFKWTHDTLSAVVGAGDRVLINSDELKLHDAIEIANRAMDRIGKLQRVDTATLETVEGQSEYAVAVAWKFGKPQRIDLQTRTDNANDHGWRPEENWDYIPAGPNATGLLVFYDPLLAGRDIRIWYLVAHPRLVLWGDYIDEVIAEELMRSACTAEALDFLVRRDGQGADPELKRARDIAAIDFARAKVDNRLYREPNTAGRRPPRAYKSRPTRSI